MAFVLAIPCIQSSIGLGLGPNFICFGHGNYIVGHIPFRVVYFCAANEINTASTGPRESDDATQGIKRGAVRGKTHTHENEMPLRRRKKIVGGAAFAAAGGEISMAEQRSCWYPRGERRSDEKSLPLPLLLLLMRAAHTEKHTGRPQGLTRTEKKWEHLGIS